MHTLITPDTITKLAQLGDATRFEPSGDQPMMERRRAPYQSHSLAECITNVSTPTGKKPIMKAMLTTACERNCFYCPFRAGRSKTRRMTFSPDEMAGAFDTLQRADRAQGIFLSSGIIKGSVTTQDKIIDTIEIIRHRYQYQGYVHLKIMPGVQYEQLYRAMQLADRISVNLEGPTQDRLSSLAPKKGFANELLKMLRWAEVIRRENPHQKLARTVTQFVVGAVGDTDHELLSISERLYRHAGLTRAYYSGFSPVEQTPFENLVPTDPLREFRLYQASFLLRDYGWSIHDLDFLFDGNLPTHIDPKHAWAERHLRQSPVEIMTAERAQLLRVPGIGPTGADRIIHARRQGRIADLAHLRKLQIRAPEQAAPYMLLDGHRPTTQMSLFQ
ncbi:MAG TPA: radical SAM protein [Ktedonobacteraceae bacterium]|nr:radical SAM protein [Ktedonobacteraceae bacterium]